MITHISSSPIEIVTFFKLAAVAQMQDCPSKVPVWCNSTNVGSNHAAVLGGRQKFPAAPSAEIRALWGISNKICLKNNSLRFFWAGDLVQ